MTDKAWRASEYLLHSGEMSFHRGSDTGMSADWRESVKVMKLAKWSDVSESICSQVELAAICGGPIARSNVEPWMDVGIL